MPVRAAMVTVSDGRAEDASEVRAFFAAAYGPSYVLARDEPLFCWQFGGPPRSADPHVLLARRGGRIVGALGYIPVEVSLEGRVRRGAWTCNWIARPDQGVPAGPVLMRELARRHDVTLALGLSAQARALLPRLGFGEAHVLRRLVRVLDAKAARALAPADMEPSLRANLPHPGARDGARRVSSVTEDMSVSWDALALQGTRRDASYLTWRYAMHPRFAYQIWEWRRARVRAVAVARMDRARDVGTQVCRIVDLAGERDAVAGLADVIALDAAAAGAAVVDLFVSDGAIAGALLHGGWRDAAGPELAWLPRLLQPVDHRRSHVHFLAYLARPLRGGGRRQWHLTLGDGDQDRPN